MTEDVDMTEYERLRLEKIRTNQAFLASLSIPGRSIEAALPSAVAHSGRLLPSGGKKKRKPFVSSSDVHKNARVAENLPARRLSARLQRRLEEEEARRSGKKVGVARQKPILQASSPVRMIEKRPARPVGKIPFSPHIGATSDFLKVVEAANGIVKEEEPAGKRMTKSAEKAIAGYEMAEEYHMAKVIKERIYSMAIHPNSEKMLICVGGKVGELGFWDVAAYTSSMHSSAGQEGAGLYNFKPHSNSITTLKYHPTNPTKLFSSSYDGSIRCMDLVRGEFEEIYADNHENFITILDHDESGNVWLFPNTAGVLAALDIREARQPETFHLHGKKIGGFGVSQPQPNYIATSSLDDTIKIWDRRMLKAEDSIPVTVFEYKRAVTAVQFHPHDSGKLVSTCYDNTVRFHCNVTGSGSEEPAATDTVFHNNQTGRWITVFKAIYDPKYRGSAQSTVVIGNMDRGLDLLFESPATAPRTMRTVYSPWLSAQPAVNTIHPRLDVIASGTASGKVVLWTCRSQ